MDNRTAARFIDEMERVSKALTSVRALCFAEFYTMPDGFTAALTDSIRLVDTCSLNNLQPVTSSLRYTASTIGTSSATISSMINDILSRLYRWRLIVQTDEPDAIYLLTCHPSELPIITTIRYG